MPYPPSISNIPRQPYALVQTHWKKSVHIARSPPLRFRHRMLLSAASWHGSKYSLYALLFVTIASVLISLYKHFVTKCSRRRGWEGKRRGVRIESGGCGTGPFVFGRFVVGFGRGFRGHGGSETGLAALRKGVLLLLLRLCCDAQMSADDAVLSISSAEAPRVARRICIA